MFNIFKKKENHVLYSMANGKSVAIEEVPDEVFATKMMGDGIAVIPTEGKIYAPCDGVVSMVMDNTKHAVGIVSDTGLEMLIHVGLDTVELMGEGFTTHVSAKDKIEKGDLLISYDHNDFISKGINDITMLIIVDPKDYQIVSYNTKQNVHFV